MEALLRNAPTASLTSSGERATDPTGKHKRRTLPDVSHFDQLPDSALISIKALAVVLGRGVSTLWSDIKKVPDFPPPIYVSDGCTRFRVGHIRAYLAKKADSSLKAKRALRSKGQVKV